MVWDSFLVECSSHKYRLSFSPLLYFRIAEKYWFGYCDLAAVQVQQLLSHFLAKQGRKNREFGNKTSVVNVWFFLWIQWISWFSFVIEMQVCLHETLIHWNLTACHEWKWLWGRAALSSGDQCVQYSECQGLCCKAENREDHSGMTATRGKKERKKESTAVLDCLGISKWASTCVYASWRNVHTTMNNFPGFSTAVSSSWDLSFSATVVILSADK